MKRRTLLLLSAPLFGAVSALALPDEFVHLGGDNVGDVFEPNCIAEAIMTEEAINIDGALDEDIWTTILDNPSFVYDFPHLTWDTSGPEWGENLPDEWDENDLSGNWMAAWDETYLYIAGSVTDDSYIPGQGLDLVEMFIDGDASLMEGIAWNVSGYNIVELNDWQVMISESEASYGLHSLNGENDIIYQEGLDIEQAFTATGSGYNFEIRIAWESIYGDDAYVIDPAVDAYIGFDLKLQDDDDGAERELVIGWCSETNDTYSNSAEFGVIVLSQMGTVVECDTETPWWVADEDGFAQSEIGWFYVGFWPFVYSYGYNMNEDSGGGDWMWIWADGPAAEGFDCPTDEYFFGYNFESETYFWSNATWGWVYFMDENGWVQAVN